MNTTTPFYTESSHSRFDPWAAPERLYLFEERAAIHQFEGGCSVSVAEALARGDRAAVEILEPFGKPVTSVHA